MFKYFSMILIHNSIIQQRYVHQIAFTYLCIHFLLYSISLIYKIKYIALKIAKSGEKYFLPKTEEERSFASIFVTYDFLESKRVQLIFRNSDTKLTFVFRRCCANLRVPKVRLKSNKATSEDGRSESSTPAKGASRVGETSTSVADTLCT